MDVIVGGFEGGIGIAEEVVEKVCFRVIEQWWTNGRSGDDGNVGLAGIVLGGMVE